MVADAPSPPAPPLPTPRAGNKASDAAWRHLPPLTADAPTHLARTQALLEAVGAGRAPATVCVERWSAPALVLGTAQPAAAIDPGALAARGVALARRLAGGAAVYTAPEYLSFAIVAPAAHPLVRGDILATYRALGEAVWAALRALGLDTRLLPVEEARARPTPAALRPFCYGGVSPHELLVGDRKLVGVAQVRRFGAVAYVGGLYRRFAPAEHAALFTGDAATRGTRAALLAECLTDLTAAGRPEAFDRFPAALIAALADRCAIPLAPGCLTDDERDRAARLRDERYRQDAWTFRH